MLVAVTGANGFLGSYLSNYLEKNNYKVRRIQRNSNKNVLLIKDINKNTNWVNALKNVDVVIHCAAKVHVLNNKEININSFYSLNVDATKNLAEQAAKCGVKKFIFISTIKVFGEHTNFNCKFSLDSPLSPKDHYSNSKLKAELALNKISANNKMDLVIIRPPLIYGPKVGANFLKMLHYIDDRFPIPFGLIKNKRSIIYIGNIADFIMKCIESNNINGKVFLPSDGISLSTAELTEKIGFYLNKKVILINIPKFILLISSYIIGKQSMLKKLINSLDIDSSQSHKSINWQPPFTSNEGLQRTVKWFKEENSKNR